MDALKPVKLHFQKDRGDHPPLNHKRVNGVSFEHGLVEVIILKAVK